MLTCRPAWATILSATLLASLPLALAGCGDAQALKSDERVATTTPTTSPGMESKGGPSVTARPKPQPGAKTVALERVGDRPYDKTFDDLRFDIQPGDPFHRAMLPESIEAMEGQRIRIRGYILPTPQKRGIKQFVLVRDNQECCFGPGAAIYDCILVEMEPGNTAEFSIRPVAVEGTFGIQEIRGPDGSHLAIYHLDAESVR